MVNSPPRAGTVRPCGQSLPKVRVSGPGRPLLSCKCPSPAEPDALPEAEPGDVRRLRAVSCPGRPVFPFINQDGLDQSGRRLQGLGWEASAGGSRATHRLAPRRKPGFNFKDALSANCACSKVPFQAALGEGTLFRFSLGRCMQFGTLQEKSSFNFHLYFQTLFKKCGTVVLKTCTRMLISKIRFQLQVVIIAKLFEDFLWHDG